jgi:hypothetical protein
MTNYQRLLDAGLISPTAQFSDSDKALIESLSSDEVDAMISIHAKTGDFVQQHAQAAGLAPQKCAIGIVF